MDGYPATTDLVEALEGRFLRSLDEATPQEHLAQATGPQGRTLLIAFSDRENVGQFLFDGLGGLMGDIFGAWHITRVLKAEGRTPVIDPAFNPDLPSAVPGEA